jgi:hypothetical protein
LDPLLNTYSIFKKKTAFVSGCNDEIAATFRLNTPKIAQPPRRIGYRDDIGQMGERSITTNGLFSMSNPVGTQKKCLRPIKKGPPFEGAAQVRDQLTFATISHNGGVVLFIAKNRQSNCIVPGR